MDGIIVVWIVVAVACAYIGKSLGSQKEAESAGFWAGLLLGPFGLLLATLIDGRACCPTCGSRLNRRPAVCPGCATRFEWSDGAKLGTYYPPAGKAGAAPPRSRNLMACPDCGNHVSKLAKACPKCGRPVALTPERPSGAGGS